ncbi:MAG: glycosyltransferase family 39 protein [Elusimicrobia bacterium]|nr:glycosyltransferase family 39 protein [Elusimicrobiota bacterium]
MDRRRLRLLLDSPERAWLALALVLRAAFALRLGGAFYQTDEHSFAAAARTLASSGFVGIGGVPTSGPPVPAALYGLGFRLFGPSLLGPRLLEGLVGVLLAAAVGRATAALTRSRDAGRLALIVACVYPFFVYYGGLLMSETPYVTLAFPALALLALGVRDESAPLLCGGGFLLGLAALARAEAAPIALLVFAAAAAARADRRSLRRLALAVLCWAVPLLGWCARNRAELGAFTLDDHGGITLLHGTMFFDANEIDTTVAMKEFEATPLAARTNGLPAPERDRALMRAGFAWIFSHPAQVARQWVRKFVNFWRFYPRVDKRYPDDAVANPSAGASRGLLVAVSLLFEPALILGGLAGLWTLRARRELWTLWAFLLGTTGVHVFIISQMRYRLPVMPILMVGAAALAARALDGGAPQSETR